MSNPDREKLEAWVNQLGLAQKSAPNCKTRKGKELVAAATVKIAILLERLLDEIEEL